jgi:probable rRNA maturation factor
MKALIVDQSSGARLPRRWLEKWAAALSPLLARSGYPGLSRRELVIVFVGAREMKRLNSQYRGKDYATDILSFESADPSCVGELVLCPPTIRAQARRTGLGERGELGYMIVHGVLHLLGLDHVDPAGEARMFALQDQLYARLRAKVGLR